MKKINYKGRCEKRKVSKFKDVCRTYTKIQSAFVDLLEKDDDVVSFECTVLFELAARGLGKPFQAVLYIVHSVFVHIVLLEISLHISQ